MKRLSIITRLAAVGYSATELSGKSNENLHAIYLQARPLLEQQSAELQKVITREQRRSKRLKAEIAHTQDQRQSHEQYHQWSQSHLPQPIVARRVEMPQNPDVEFVSAELRKAKIELRDRQRYLQRHGGREAIQKVGNARKKVEIWTEQMQEVGK